MDFVNNKAEQVLPPDIGSYKFKEYSDYKYAAMGNYIRLKVKYVQNNNTEEKFIVYKCE
ncbi:MAG: hypothetical protein IPM85_00860 [Chitinophagaceae bacterium]|nr:hypothetical protein [Chitinophagaceae bacterium]